LAGTFPPKTRYTKSGSVHLAYQVLGEGPLDLVFVTGWISHIELYWEWPESAHFLRRLASFGRLILFDKRGTGLSDRVPSAELPTLEQCMDDVRAVMDAAGSERAALLGLSEGGPMQMLFAATHPGRTAALVLMSTYARLLQAADNGRGNRRPRHPVGHHGTRPGHPPNRRPVRSCRARASPR
jgi:pimeloyl-ACP methyl ester carboxylesterase